MNLKKNRGTFYGYSNKSSFDTQNTIVKRNRELLFPLFFIPILVPILMFSSNTTVMNKFGHNSDESMPNFVPLFLCLNRKKAFKIFALENRTLISTIDK